MKTNLILAVLSLLIGHAHITAAEEMTIEDVVQTLSGEIAPENLICNQDGYITFNRYRFTKDHEKFLALYNILNEYEAAPLPKSADLLSRVKKAFKPVAGETCTIEVSSPLGDKDTLGNRLLIDCPFGVERGQYFLRKGADFWSIETASFNDLSNFRNLDSINKPVLRLYKDYPILSTAYPESTSKSIFPQIEFVSKIDP